MEWISVKERLPKIGMVVECMKPGKWFYSNLNRDFFALQKVNRELIWISPSLTDFNFKDLDIEYWRLLFPDVKGKVPFIKIKKYNRCWEPIVIYKNYIAIT